MKRLFVTTILAAVLATPALADQQIQVAIAAHRGISVGLNCNCGI